MDLSRKINIIGDIDDNAYKEFIEHMDELDEMLEGEDIIIELSSPGGDALVALAFYDRIRNSPSDVIVNAYGLVASAAVIILAAGDVRTMAKNAWVMVHEDTVPVSEDQRVSQVEGAANISRLLEDQWNRLMARRTKLSARQWAKLHKDETYLSAEGCLDAGLIEEIL